ncbi:MAG TPA: hypothetical protein PKZ20_18680, partial [Rhodocyclaceae bacterium]|nr:hypothetical protein [Rhodocyclaceae bacterium]
MPQYLSTDPNAGLGHYLSTDPNAGLNQTAEPRGFLGNLWDASKAAALTTLGMESDKSESRGGDYGRMLGRGIQVQIPQTLLGMGEVARSGVNAALPGFTAAANLITPDFLLHARDSIENWARHGLDTRSKTIGAEMTPETQASLNKPFLGDKTTWDNLTSEGMAAMPGKVADLVSSGEFFGAGMTDPTKIGGMALESAPVSVLSMVPVMRAANAAHEVAYTRALAANATQEEAQQIATRAAKNAATIMGGASEGAAGAGQQFEQTYQQVMDLPQEKLAKSPEYQKALAAIPAGTPGREQKARAIVARHASELSAAVAGAADALFAGLGDRYIGGAASGNTGRVKSIISGIAEETPTEALQSGFEQFGTNLGVRQFADPSQSLTQDVGEQAIGGGLSGGLMGGAFGAAAYQKPAQNSQPGSTSPGALPAGDVVGAAPSPVAPIAEGGDPAQPITATGTLAGQAGGTSSSKQTEAEKALLQPQPLTALDRVGEIDAEEAKLNARLQELDNPGNGYGPMFDTERQEIAAKRTDLANERNGLTKTWPAFTLGAETDFSTEAGARVKARYALAEADQLTSSHDEYLRKTPTYPPELQPRERDRAASEMQVSGIFQKLDPARLGESADAANGAPIVGADGLVESGNARTIALKRVYQANGAKAGSYKQFIKDNAARFGLSPEQVDGMRAPVLVRVRTTPVNRAEFARQANAATVAQMSPSEQAKSDAARLDVMDDLRPDDNGDFTASRDFIRRFMAKIPATEQAGMIDAGGNLSQTGYSRIRNAILAKAYGDSPVLARMVESMNDDMRNIGKALMQAAPEVAKLRQDVAEGALFDADITPDLLAAVEELARLRDSGRSVHDALAQAGMFGDKYSPETREILQFLSDNIRRPRVMAEFITRYTEALRAAGNPNQGSIFGEATAPTKGQLLSAAKGSENGTEDSSRAGAAEDAGAGK